MNIKLAELEWGCAAFEEREPRDAMYKVARELIENRWGDAEATLTRLVSCF